MRTQTTMHQDPSQRINQSSKLSRKIPKIKINKDILKLFPPSRINSNSRSETQSDYSDDYIDYDEQQDGEEIVYDSDGDVTSNRPTRIPEYDLYGVARKVMIDIPEKAPMNQIKAAKIITKAVRGRQIRQIVGLRQRSKDTQKELIKLALEEQN